MQLNRDFDRLHACLRANDIAVFLDFDGVLVAIAPTPEAVILEEAMRQALRRLQRAAGGAIAIVSGRSVATIDQKLGAKFLVAGDHGNERRRADGTIVWLNEAALGATSELARTMEAATAGDSRLVVEVKPSAVALHYRLAPERGAECEAIVAGAVENDPTWSVIRGKMVIEARASGVHKGAAVTAYMAEAPFNGRVPVFIGDDVTDEDGFAVAEGIGGFGIKVGSGPTRASITIPGQEAVLPLLNDLADRLAGGK